MNNKVSQPQQIGSPVSWKQALFGTILFNLVGGLLKHFVHFPLSDSIAGFFFIVSFIFFWVFVFKLIDAVFRRKSKN